MLHGWDNFFTLAGGASATLIGLLFVAISVGSATSASYAVSGARAFLTPTLLLFASVLLQCMAMVAPWSSAWLLGIILVVFGLVGIVWQIFVILLQRKIDFASPVWLDWVLFSAIPIFGYVGLIAGALGLIAGKLFAPYAIAGAVALLLFAGIYGAWDLTLWIVRNRDKF